MSQIIEGTWEEVKQHEAELVGHYVRVTIDPKPQHANRKASTPVVTAEPKKLVGYGAFKGVFGGTEAFLAAKQEEIELEERKFEPRP